jgi:hypothetical protein
MPPGLARALAPVLEQIAQMTLKIKKYDRQILELTQTEYPETQAFAQGSGHRPPSRPFHSSSPWGTSNASSEVGTSVAISAYDLNGASREIETLSSALLRPATSTSEVS